ncbi:MAG: molecular chaperone DnaK, partial [Halopseudomonas sp.]
AAIEAAITALEEAVKGDDKDDIEAKTAALTEAVSAVAQKMYAEAAAAEQAEGGEQQAESATAEDVVDAEFEEVKDDKK